MDKETVERIAHLARIELRPEEARVYAGQLTNILAYVEQLKEVDVEDVPPFAHTALRTNVLRSDRESDCLSADEALNGAPDRAGDHYRVPRVLESGR